MAIFGHLTDPLVVAVGGVGTDCGLILASSDLGSTWVREYHECDPASGPAMDCTTCQYTSDPCNPTNPDPAFRHQDFRTIYGTAVDASGTFYAVGYNGQHLRREVLGGTGVWRDRSTFGPWEEAPERVTLFPMNGVTASSIPDRLFVTGLGGHIRRSDDRGESYVNEAVGEPFRISDCWFKIDAQGRHVGWQIGQFFRLAWTIDGGLTWTQGEPGRLFPFGSTLHALTFAGDGMHGVTVGTHLPGSTYTPIGVDGGPRILRTLDYGAQPWREPSAVNYTSPTEETAHRNSALRAVAWAKDAGNVQFWAVGAKGLVLSTPDGGNTWTQLTLPEANPNQISLYGVAASGPEAVVVVGSNQAPPTTEARAYRYLNGVSSTIPVVPADPSNGTIERLTAVSASGSLAYAVGHRRNNDGRLTGLVMVYDAGQQAFPSGNLWIAGLCGNAFQYLAATQQWVDHKSQTSSDFLGIMFIDENLGYWAARGHVQQIIVRYQNQ